MRKIVLLLLIATVLGSKHKNKSEKNNKSKNGKAAKMTKTVYEHKFPKTSSDDTQVFAGISQKNNSNLNNEKRQKAPYTEEVSSQFSKEVSEAQPRRVCSNPFTSEELQRIYDQQRQPRADQTYQQNLLNPKDDTLNPNDYYRQVPTDETYHQNLLNAKNVLPPTLYHQNLESYNQPPKYDGQHQQQLASDVYQQSSGIPHVQQDYKPRQYAFEHKYDQDYQPHPFKKFDGRCLGNIGSEFTEGLSLEQCIREYCGLQVPAISFREYNGYCICHRDLKSVALYGYNTIRFDPGWSCWVNQNEFDVKQQFRKSFLGANGIAFVNPQGDESQKRKRYSGNDETSQMHQERIDKFVNKLVKEKLKRKKEN